MVEKIAVLIPSYNEARTIGSIVRRLVERGLPAYVVDDGSTDQTSPIAEEEGAQVIRNDINMGKGSALRIGAERILKEDFEAILIMDGDAQHDVADIDNFINKMRASRADMVVGNRMLDTSSMPAIRIAVNRFMSGLISRMTGQYIPDTQCGFRLVRREVLEVIRLESSRFEIESEIAIKTARAGFKIESVPVRTVYQDEQSRINPIIDTLRFIAFLIRLRLRG